MPERQQGNFLFPKELREQIAVPKAVLLQLGKAGLLFAQAEARDRENYTIFRYHPPYVAGVVEEFGVSLKPDEHRTQLLEYAAANTGLMSGAMNGYYDRIFAVPDGQVRPDGHPYLFRDQAREAIGLSAFKVNSYSDAEYEAPGKRPTWDPDRLAKVFNWNIPGSPETVLQVRAGLGELATRYAQFIIPGDNDQK